MRAFSLDFRKKIIEVYEQEKISIRKLAARFNVSNGVVQRLLNLKKTTGSLEPKPPSGGKPSQFVGREAEIAEMVSKHPDFTLQEYCDYLDTNLDIQVGVTTMHRVLGKLKLTRKKNAP